MDMTSRLTRGQKELGSIGVCYTPGEEFDEIPSYEADGRHWITQFLKQL